MGLLIDGVWDKQANAKNLVRESDAFHNKITADGSSGFKAEAGRYHLYISLACPWACRTLIFRKLKNLEKVISLSIVEPLMGENGWSFTDQSGCIPDIINHCHFVHQLYTKAKSNYTGRVSVPVLWDKKTQTIVNNESSEIIRMMNSEFNEFGDAKIDFYPIKLRKEIDEINEKVFTNINAGVYKCGFAANQQDYDVAFDALFTALDFIEHRLSKQRYLVGSQITEADWRLFTTLVRFDVVYYVHFKCNLRRILDYHNLQNYLQELYQYPGIAETVNFEHIKKHYYLSHTHINPTGIIPKGPELKLTQTHDRDKL